MYSTQIYQYVPRQLVIIESGSSPRRYNNVYSKNLKLHKGSDSRLQFQFLNQEEKPVDITGKEITFRLINFDDSKILLQKSLVNVLSLTGICELRINESDLSSLHTQKCYYSLETSDELGYTVPALTDKNNTGRGIVEIVNSIYPKVLSSKELSILTNTTNNPEPGVYYSSVLSTNYSSHNTIQINATDFIGTISVMGSTTGQSIWYSIDSQVYADTNTEPIVFKIIGFHPYIQLKFESTTGTINKIFVR